MLELRMAKALLYFRDEDGDHFLEVDVDDMSLESEWNDGATAYGDPTAPSLAATSLDHEPGLLTQLAEAVRWMRH
jgi:hypothetical protein